MSNTREVVIMGGGTAGMMAVITAAKEDVRVHLYEKNKKLGKKLFVTDKGRYSITDAYDAEKPLASVVSNSGFLYSNFYGFTNQNMMDLLEQAGLRLRAERGNRVFPQSDKSPDITAALTLILKREEVWIHLQRGVEGLMIEDGICVGVRMSDHIRNGEGMIVTTGGLFYPTTGSAGDGYEWARESRHKITNLSPAPAAFGVKGADIVEELQRLSLKNMEAQILASKKGLFRDFGGILFTHSGVNDPLLLSTSLFGAKAIRKQPLNLVIDSEPALSTEQLDDRILRNFTENMSKQFRSSLSHLYPSKLIPVIITRSDIGPDKKVNKVTKKERAKFVKVIKRLTFTLTGLRDYREAVITQGGISTRDINPSIMEFKRVRELYLAEEILDLNAITGGFNPQIAQSTEWVTGRGTVLIQGQSGRDTGRRLRTHYKTGE